MKQGRRKRQDLQPRAGGQLKPNPGPWGLSYVLLDREGDFAWPDPDRFIAHDLAITLQNLAAMPFEAMANLTRVGGATANKSIDPSDLTERANDRLDVLTALHQDMDFSELALFEFTYCHRTAHPARIWAMYQSSTRMMFPIWWDPSHEVCGHNPNFPKKVGGQCPDTCPHPSPLCENLGRWEDEPGRA